MGRLWACGVESGDLGIIKAEPIPEKYRTIWWTEEQRVTLEHHESKRVIAHMKAHGWEVLGSIETLPDGVWHGLLGR